VEPNRTTSVDVISPALPSDGAVRVEMFGCIDLQPSSGATVQSYRLSLPTLLPVGIDGQPSETITRALKADVEQGEVYELETMHGTGPTGSHPAATRIEPGDAAELADDWKVGPYQTGDELTGITAAEILAREALFQLHSTRSVIDWTPVNAEPSLTKAAKKPDGSRFLPVHKQTLYKTGHQSIQAVRLRRDDSISLSFVEKTGESSSGGSGGGGAAGGGGGSATWPVPGTPEELLSLSGQGDTKRLPTELSAFRPFVPPAGAVMLRHSSNYPYSVLFLRGSADTAPSQDRSFDLVIGSTTSSIVWPAGQSEPTWELSEDVPEGGVVEITIAEAAESLEDVTFSFKLERQ